VQYIPCQLTSKNVVKRDDHTARDVEKLTVDLQNLGRCCEILLEAMGWCSEQHQCTAHADEVLLPLENIGNVDLDAYILVILGLDDLGEDASAATPLVLRRVHGGILLLVIGICQFG